MPGVAPFSLMYTMIIVYTLLMDELTRMGIRDFREHITSRVEKAHFREEPTVITKNGNPRAVVVSVDWYERAVQALKNPEK